VVRNTTSVVASAFTRPPQSRTPDETHYGFAADNLGQPLTVQRLASSSVGWLVQVDDTSIVYFDHQKKELIPHMLLGLSHGLNASQSHSFRMTHTGSLDGEEAMVVFGGVWLDKGGHLEEVPDIPIERPHNHSMFNSPDEAYADGYAAQTERDSSASQRRRLIEVITTSLKFADDVNLASDARPDALSALGHLASWPKRLAKHLASDVRICYLPNATVVETDDSKKSVADVYFQSCYSSKALSKDSHTVSSSQPPDVILLDVGTPDLLPLFETSSPFNNHQVVQHIAQFSTSLRKYIATLRRKTPAARSEYMSVDHSYEYNSAPSTVPIFLLLPLLQPTQFALQSVLAHAIQSTVSILQKNGDVSTFYIDTFGWLDQEDFLDTSNTTDRLFPRLAPNAHVKIAAYLSMHLCYFLSPNPEDCPFDRRDEYLGNVYLPDEASLQKMIEENKVQRIKELFGMNKDEL